MDRTIYRQIVELGRTPSAQEGSIAYLTEHLGHFLRKGERVFICFSEHEEGNLSWLMEQAVVRCGAVPVVWGPDRRWKTLLQQAFVNKVTAIIGSPLLLLGLSKLRRQSGTPLSIRRVITAGYPCPQWMIDGIVKGLDCEVGGCFTLDISGVVAGFACGHSWGVHIREDSYGVDIVDAQGHSVESGQMGEIVLYPKDRPELRWHLREGGRLETEACACGSTAVRMMDMVAGWGTDPALLELEQMLHSWTSVLDCHVARGESGLEIEIVCFQGEKLPKLPTAAKLVVRPWDPQTDAPYSYARAREIEEK